MQQRLYILKLLSHPQDVDAILIINSRYLKERSCNGQLVPTMFFHSVVLQSIPTALCSSNSINISNFNSFILKISLQQSVTRWVRQWSITDFYLNKLPTNCCSSDESLSLTLRSKFDNHSDCLCKKENHLSYSVMQNRKIKIIGGASLEPEPVTMIREWMVLCRIKGI